MSLSPANLEDGASPELGMAQVRVNLNSRFVSTGQEMTKDCMEVYARVRPLLSDELDKGFKECIGVIDEETVRAVFPASSNKNKSNRTSQEITEDFKFTTAFGPDVNQFSFFEETMMPTMVNFIEGHNSLVFSYGITGSGKTYTLQGNADNPGVIPISLKLFFSAIEDQILVEPIVKPDNFSDVLLLTQHEKNQEMLLKEHLLKSHKVKDMSLFSNSSDPKKTFAMILCELFSDKYQVPERETTLPPEEMIAAQSACQMKDISKKSAAQMEGRCCVWVSFVEIYNENIYDLLQAPLKNGRRNGLSIAEDNGDVFIKGVQQVFVSNSDEALQLLMLGRRNLKIASTRLNYESSRSHCIYSLKVVRIPSEKDIPYANVNWLSFCDLAGSERSGKADTHGLRLKEASYINTSLLVLGRCLELLRSNQTARDKKMIPFRESKLTRLLSNFLLGKGKAVMISNVSPSEYTFDETHHVLRYSAIAQQIHVNDRFISCTSSTLQSISEQWAQSKQNVSDISCNVSGLDESYEDLVQEKDDFIAKLLQIAESLTQKLKKEKEEKADMEYTIRQKVLREYAESSDQYLKKQQETHEEEKRAIRKGHAERIAAMEKRYDALLKRYEEGDESHESLEVSEDNIDMYDEDSPEAEPQSSGLLPMQEKRQSQEKLEEEQEIKNIPKNLANSDTPKKFTLNPNSRDLTYDADANSLTTDSQDKNMTMSENTLKRKLAKRAEFQKFVLENEDLSKVCSPNTAMFGKVKMNPNIIDSLEQKISSLTSELQKTKEELETNRSNSVNLEKEINQCKEIISSLKAENLELAALKMKQISDIEKGIEAKRFIQEELTKTLKELNERESEISSLKEELASVEKYKGEAFALSEKYESLKGEKANLQDKYFAMSEELAVVKEELATLESKLAESKTLCDDYKTKYTSLKESKVKTDEKRISHLSSDLEDTREALNAEKLRSKEFADTIKKQNSDFTAVQEMYLSKEKELRTLQEIRKDLDESVSTLKNKLDRTTQSLNSEKMVSKDLSNAIMKQNSDLVALQEKMLSKEKELEALEEVKKALDENVSTLKDKLDRTTQSLNSEKMVSKDLSNAIMKQNSDLVALQEKMLSKEKELEALEEVKKALDENVSTLKDKLDRTTQSLNSEKMVSKDLSNAIMKQNSDLVALQEKMLSKEKELEALEEVKKALDENVSTLKDKLDAARNNTEDESSIHENCRRKLSDLKKSCESKETEIFVLQENIAKIKNEMEAVVLELKEVASTFSASETISALHAANKDIKEANDSLTECDVDITSAKERKSKKSFGNNELSRAVIADITEMQLHIKNLKKLVLSFKEKMSLKDVETSKLEKSLALVKQELDAVNSELSDAIKKHNCEFTTLQEKYSSKEKELKALEEVKKALDENVSILKDKLVHIEESLKSEKIKSKELLDAYEKQNLDFITLQKQFLSKEKDLEALEEVKKTLEENVSTWKDKLESLKSEKMKSKELSGVIEKQNLDFITLQEKYSSKERELKALEELKKSLEENESILRDKLDTTSTHSDLILILERCELRATERYDAILQQYSQEKAKCDELKEKLNKTEEESQKKQDTLYHLIEVLEKCECTAYCSQKKLLMESQMYKENISNLKRNAKYQENNTEDLEKALCDVQKQLRDLHKSSQEKLDDQELEINKLKQENDILMEENERMKQNMEQLKKQTSELHIVEEENKQLKSKVLRHELQKEPAKRVLKERGNQACTVETDEGKAGAKRRETDNGKAEGTKRRSKKTSVRKKESKDSPERNEIESSRVSSLRSRENKISYVEEHLGDSDVDAFEPQRRRVQKKGSVASLQARRKVMENSENISPVRKFANYVGSTLKAAGTNVVKSMPSPRLTRGKKKLFNTDAH